MTRKYRVNKDALARQATYATYIRTNVAEGHAATKLEIASKRVERFAIVVADDVPAEYRLPILR